MKLQEAISRFGLEAKSKLSSPGATGAITPRRKLEPRPRRRHECYRLVEVIQGNEDTLRLGPPAHALVRGMCPRKDLHPPTALVHPLQSAVEAGAFKVTGTVPGKMKTRSMLASGMKETRSVSAGRAQSMLTASGPQW